MSQTEMWTAAWLIGRDIPTTRQLLPFFFISYSLSHLIEFMSLFRFSFSFLFSSSWFVSSAFSCNSAFLRVESSLHFSPLSHCNMMFCLCMRVSQWSVKSSKSALFFSSLVLVDSSDEYQLCSRAASLGTLVGQWLFSYHTHAHTHTQTHCILVCMFSRDSAFGLQQTHIELGWGTFFSHALSLSPKHTWTLSPSLSMFL